MSQQTIPIPDSKSIMHPDSLPDSIWYAAIENVLSALGIKNRGVIGVSDMGEFLNVPESLLRSWYYYGGMPENIKSKISKLGGPNGEFIAKMMLAGKNKSWQPNTLCSKK